MFFETLKANLLIIVFFAAIGLLGYWAVVSLQVDPDEFESQLVDVQPIIENDPAGVSESTSTAPSTSTTTSSSGTSSQTSSGTNNAKYSEIKSALEKLVSDNILMKAGSRGTRVGTVQQFLNIYNGTDSTIDNDYGPTTENQIKAFQKAEGLTADGQTGPNTYKKMIAWLDKQ